MKKGTRKTCMTVALALIVCLCAVAFTACKQTDESFTVTFVNYDDSVLDTVQVQSGETPEYDGAVPQRASTPENSYVFAGWSLDGATLLDSLPAVTANVTFKAVFTRTDRTYTVEFKSEDGTETLYTARELAYNATAEYVGSTPEKDATAQYSYTFAGWSLTAGGEVVDTLNATGDLTVYASFTSTLRQYTILYKSEDGTVTLGTETVSYGEPFAAALSPTKTGTAQYSYTFVGWSDDTNSAGDVVTDTTVTGNRILYAKFTESVNTYDVIFYNGPVELYRVQAVEYGEIVTLADVYEGQPPTKEADSQYTYTFNGWGDADGNALTQAQVTGETSVYAQYATSALTYTVTFLSEDGQTVLYTQNDVAFGTTVSYAGETPTKTADGEKYVFVGWSYQSGSAGETLDEVVVTGTTNVYAKFKQYNLSVTYVYALGGQAAPGVYELVEGATYSVPSPVVRDYVPDIYLAAGTLADTGTDVTVTYTAISALPFDTYSVETTSSSLNGSGTQNEPFLISSAADFKYFADQVNGGNDYAGQYVKLTANVDLAGAGFMVGTASTAASDYTIGKAFAGTFDGDGHVLKGRSGTGAFSAYFAAVTGTVKNLTVLGSVNGNGRLGGLAILVKDGAIENCTSYVEITGTIVELGGIAAVNWGGAIRNCVNFGKVEYAGTGTANYNFGGIVSRNYAGGTVEACVNYGAVSSKCTDVGGIVGRNEGATITDCVNYGTVTNTASPRTGGIVGYNISSGTVENCTNYGAVSGTRVVGGIVGNNENSTPATLVNGCVNYGDVTSQTDATGGIAGYAKGSLTNCRNYGHIIGGTIETGGIAGSIQTVNGAVTGCENYGSVEGATYVGGIAGDVQQSATMSGNANGGSVTGTDYVGGVVGSIYETAGTVADNTNAGTVTGSGEHVGDIAGADAYAQ